MSIDGKLSSEQVKEFERVIDDMIIELDECEERYAEVIAKHPVEWMHNQVIFWRNSKSCLRGLKSRIRDMERP